MPFVSDKRSALVTFESPHDGVRLINQSGVQHADGHGYVIRNGIIIVPKDGVIPDGTTV